MANAFALQKAKLQKKLEEDSRGVQYNNTNNKRGRAGQLNSSLADRFESPQVKAARREREEEERKKFMEQERKIQAADAASRRLREEQERLAAEERLALELVEEQERRLREEANLRIQERRRLRDEEEKRLADLKPAQAIFERAKKSRQSVKTEPRVANLSGGVGDLRKKLMQQQQRDIKIGDKKEFEQELQGLMAEEESPIRPKRSNKALDVYTKGNCSNIKSAFEDNIAQKRKIVAPEEMLPSPATRRRTSVQQKQIGAKKLPNMFEQVEKREMEFQRQKEMKERPVKNKKVMNKFLAEDNSNESKPKFTSWKKKAEPGLTWTQKQELNNLQRLEEEERLKNLQRQQEEEELREKEMLDRLQKEREEEEELQKQILAAKAEAKAAKAKKKLKTTKSKTDLAPKELPTIVLPTASNLRKTFQDTITRHRSGVQVNEPSRKQVGRLTANPFESKASSGYESKQVVIPVVKGNKLSDIRRKYDVDQQQKQQQRNSVESDSKKKPVEEEQSKDAPTTKLGDSSNNQKKKSKEEMQNYLIQHLLFDKELEEKKEKEEAEAERKLKESSVKTQPQFKKEASVESFVVESDDEPVQLDPEYLKEMEKYLMFLPDDSKKKKKKKVNKKKVNKDSKLKIVEVNNIKNRFVENMIEKTPSNKSLVMQSFDKKVGKFKSLFESSKPKQVEARQNAESVPARQTRLISSDLLSKFDDPEAAAHLRTQREVEREERRRRRLQKLEEEKAEMERLEKLRVEEERKEELRKIEESRLEMERLEEEERQKILLEAAMKEQKMKAEMRQKNEVKMRKKREKNEPALKKKKVLGRISHLFEKQLEEDYTNSNNNNNSNIGSIKGMAEDLFGNEDDDDFVKKKTFQDASLTGVSSVLSKMKNKFEFKEEKPLALTHGVERRKDACLPVAVMFEIQEQVNVAKASLNIQKSASETDWAWKKKDPKQLALDALPTRTAADEKDKQKPKLARSNEENQKMLLDDIHKTSERLKKKDALKEDKMKDYEDFMREIQGYLNEPSESIEDADFKDDIQSYIKEKNVSGTNKAKPKKAKKVLSKSTSSVQRLGDIKQMLQQSKNGSSGVAQAATFGTGVSIKQMQQSLFFQEEETATNNRKISADQIGKVKNFFEENLEEERSRPKAGKTKVMKKIVDMPQFTGTETVDSGAIRKSSYEWKYKKKNIQELQEFLTGNKAMVPKAMNNKLLGVKENLKEEVKAKTEDSEEEENEQEVEDYNELMSEVDRFLNATDRSANEVNFKAEVEKYLDLIEEPSPNVKVKPKTTKPKAPPPPLQKVKHPKKLIDVSLWNERERSLTPPPVGRDTSSKYVNDLKNRLIQEIGKTTDDSTKEDVFVAGGVASALKKNYERMSKKEEVSLLGARTIQLQRNVEQVVQDSGVKSLDELKAERNASKWAWKNKDASELNNVLRSYDREPPEALAERQEKLERFEEKLQRVEATAKTEEELDDIKRIREEKDREFDAFIKEVRDFVGESPNDGDPILKHGMMSYLDIIDDEPKKRPSLYDRSAKDNAKTRTLGGGSEVKMRRKLLEQSFDDGLSNQEKRMSDHWAVGKIDTSFLEDPTEEDYRSANRNLEPVMSGVNASHIRAQLEAQCREDISMEPLGRARVPQKLIDTSMFEQLVDTSKPTLTKKAADEWKWKQKRIQDLQSFIGKNQEMAPSKVVGNTRPESPSIEADHVMKQAEENEKYLEEVVNFVNSSSNHGQENEFKQTIQVYLDLIDNSGDRNAEAKQQLKVLEGTHRVSNLKKQILDKPSGLDSRRSHAVGKLSTGAAAIFGDDNGETSPTRMTLHQPSRDGRWCEDVRKKLEGGDNEDRPLLAAPRNKLVHIAVKDDILPQAGQTRTKAKHQWSSGDNKPLRENFDKMAKQVEEKSKQKPVRPDEHAYLRGITDPEERKKAILDKYGFKHRPVREDSSSSSEDEDAIPMHVLQNDDLYQMYTERRSRASPSPPRGTRRRTEKQMSTLDDEQQTSQPGSFGAFKNIMSMVRQSKIGQVVQQSKQMFSGSREQGLNKIKSESVEDLQLHKGSCSDLRSQFEDRGRGRDKVDARTPFPVKSMSRSMSCTNIKNTFERPSPEVTRRRMPEDLPGRSRVSQVRKSLLEPDEDESPQHSRALPGDISRQNSSLMRKRLELMGGSAGPQEKARLPLGKSPSFSKFREAFEAGKAGELSDSDEEGYDYQRRPTQMGSDVQAELEALRSNPRLQRMMKINGPRQGGGSLMHSQSVSHERAAVDLNDDETREEMSKSRSAIKNIFESSAPKITFGGSGLKKSLTDKPSLLGAKPKRTQLPAATERKWVFDVINKYFDVIDEEEPAGDEEEEEEGSSEEEEGEQTYSSQVSCNTSIYSNSNRSSFISNYNVDRSTSNVMDKMQEEEEESEEEEAEMRQPISLSKTQSSHKLRGMLASVLSRKQSSADDSTLSRFKENLGQHLLRTKSRESLGTSPYLSRRGISNTDGASPDSESEDEFEDCEQVYENNNYKRVPL